jgi:predicted nucleic acid-binding protein
MRPLLTDASVWLASRDPDDTAHAVAKQLIEAATLRGPPLAALDLTLYELANVTVRRWRRPREGHRLARLVREACEERLVRVDETLLGQAIDLAEAHNLSAYDAAYVACAHLRGWTLVSLDERDLVGPGHAVLPAAVL